MVQMILTGEYFEQPGEHGLQGGHKWRFHWGTGGLWQVFDGGTEYLYLNLYHKYSTCTLQCTLICSIVALSLSQDTGGLRQVLLITISFFSQGFCPWRNYKKVKVVSVPVRESGKGPYMYILSYPFSCWLAGLARGSSFGPSTEPHQSWSVSRGR